MCKAQFPIKVAFSRHRIFKRWLVFEWMTKQVRLPISRNVNFQDYKIALASRAWAIFDVIEKIILH